MATQRMTRAQSARINRRNLRLGAWDALAVCGLLYLVNGVIALAWGLEPMRAHVSDVPAVVVLWLMAFGWRQLVSGQFRRRRNP